MHPFMVIRIHATFSPFTSFTFTITFRFRFAFTITFRFAFTFQNKTYICFFMRFSMRIPSFSVSTIDSILDL